nr:purine-binding chemotaxis protein CheW [candidate division Zixibacteria bacterium]
METSDTAVREGDSRAGKYLTFRLANEEYGLEILKVREIIGLMEITGVPQTPSHIRGVINLRGKVIPVLDLRLKFGMDAAEDTDQTCIVVVEVTFGDQSVMTGVVVDAVSEVLDIDDEQIEDAPTFGGGVETDFILGIGKIKNEVKILLDIDKVLNTGDMAILNDMGESVEGKTMNVAELETAGV